MPRTLSMPLPEEIQSLITANGYRDITDLAVKNGIHPKTVNHFFIRNTHQQLHIFGALADVVGISLEKFYWICKSDDLDRQKRIDRLLGTKLSLSQWAKLAGTTSATTSNIRSGKISCSSLDTSKRIGMAVGLNLDELRHVLKKNAA